MSTPYLTGTTKATDTMLQKLEAALNADGDFPVRARAVSDLRRLVNDPNTPVEKIVEIILSEPSLGTRILHLVNSVCYKRGQSIITVSQAVVQLGMRALCDLCSGFVLMQRFSPAAQKGGVFADNVKKGILTSAITTSLVTELGKPDQAEQGYLAGTFFSIGPLLLAYYFPQVFETADKRAKARGQTITQSLTETIGIPPVGLSLGVVDALAIPQYYRDLLVAAYGAFVEEKLADEKYDYRDMANLLATAARLADAIIDSASKAELRKLLEEIAERSGFSVPQLNLVLKHTPETFKQHCKMIEMSFLTLPEHFTNYLETFDEEEKTETIDESAVGGDFSFYLDEIREAIANHETLSSIITTAMEALAFGQKFDRVLLLVMDTNEDALVGKMALGDSFPSDPKSIKRDLEFLDAESAPDLKALVEGTVEIYGDPLFKDGWPFAAIPVGSGDNAMGVLYADVLESSKEGGKAIDGNVNLALTLLASLLEQAALQENT